LHLALADPAMHTEAPELIHRLIEWVELHPAEREDFGSNWSARLPAWCGSPPGPRA
jgi:hypothetical protein